MVVALDLERDRLAVTEIDHAGVLAGSLEYAGAGGRESPEKLGGVLVAAVLRPEQREDSELEVVRVAVEQLADTVELSVGETEGPMEQLFPDLRQVSESSGEGGRLPRSFSQTWVAERFTFDEP